jgi:hypothetical protein
MVILKTDPHVNYNDQITLKNGDMSPLQYDIISDDIPGVPNQDSTRYQADFYKYFGLDIVAETVFDFPYPFITEKTFRPITSKRPFVIIGASHSLALLRSKNFKTFDMIIDESYDSITDYSDRFDSVTFSIKKFVTQPIEKIRLDVQSVSSILDHNFKTYLELEDIELSQLNL